MRKKAVVVITLLLLMSCGRRDSSGIYISSTDREVTLVQLVQTKDGALTGRLESLSINANGNLDDRIVALDGAASDGNLVFKPNSIWSGGLQATGMVTGEGLSLTTGGNTFLLERSTLQEYQAAVKKLHVAAARKRQFIAEEKAATAAREAQQALLKAASDRAKTLTDAANRLRIDADALDNGLAKSPDFGSQAAANTGRITRILELARKVPLPQRSQLGVNANQLEVDTNQVEVARTQYANELNQLIQDASWIAARVESTCASQSSGFDQNCKLAKGAVAHFKDSVDKGRKTFGSYKDAVRSELEKQRVLLQQIDGLM